MLSLTALLLTLSAPAAGLGPAPPARLAPVVVRHDREEAETRALAARYPATVEVVGAGTGTLVTERWVLTAAHVTGELSPFSPRVRVGGETIAVRQVLLHPEGRGDGPGPPPVDLALLELAKAVEGVSPVALCGRRDEAGREAVLVGYGDHGLGAAAADREPFQPWDGTARAATNVIDRADEGHLVIDFDKPPGGTALEGVGAPGDSGGPLYVTVDDTLLLAGVSSGSRGGPPGAYGVEDLYVRVSAYSAWIERTLAERTGAEPAGPALEDIRKGFPAEPRGDVAAAFVELLGLGDVELARQFAADLRSGGAAERAPHDVFARRMAEVGNELGTLEAHRLARLEADRWALLVRSERAGWRCLFLHFVTEVGAVRLDDFAQRPEPAPSAPDAEGADQDDR